MSNLFERLSNWLNNSTWNKPFPGVEEPNWTFDTCRWIPSTDSTGPASPPVPYDAAAVRRLAEVKNLRAQLKEVIQRRIEAEVNKSVARQFAEKHRQTAAKKKPGWLQFVRAAKHYDELAKENRGSENCYRMVEKNLLRQLANHA